MDKRRFAILTSGGDAPGMNAAIRAVVRTGIHLGHEIIGINEGFRGLLDAHFHTLSARDVGGIIQQGGTILGSARCPEFKTGNGVQKAKNNLEKTGIQGLVVIGGNGSQTGAAALAATGFPVVGIASTIDNDLCGTDISIGVDTALGHVQRGGAPALLIACWQRALESQQSNVYTARCPAFSSAYKRDR